MHSRLIVASFIAFLAAGALMLAGCVQAPETSSTSSTLAATPTASPDNSGLPPLPPGQQSDSAPPSPAN